MQTPKSRTISIEVPQRTSPATSSKTARKLKTAGTGADSVSSPNPVSRTPKDRSPKVVARRSPRSPAVEKRPGRVSGLENQLPQIQEEVKKTKDQLSSSESSERKSQLEADEVKKQLAAMSEKLEESEKQLLERSYSEEARLLELRKVSQDRDQAWQSELETLQKQHELDSNALASAMNEIQWLKIQLDKVADSEASQTRHAESANAEIQRLRVELTETVTLVEQLQNQLNKSKETEACTLEEVSNAQLQLEVTKTMKDTLCFESLKAMEACNSLSLELEQSNSQVASLEELLEQSNIQVSAFEELLKNFPSDQGSKSLNRTDPSESSAAIHENGINMEADETKTDLRNLKGEVNQLTAALEDYEKRYQEECIKSSFQIRNAYEMVDCTKSELIQKETELNKKLNATKADVEVLKEKLMSKEAELQKIRDENKELKLQIEEIQAADTVSELVAELRKSESILADLRASLLDKETELQSTIEENETLKSEIKKKEMESSKVNNDVLALAEAARTAESEALIKLESLTEEADKSNKKAARVLEELNAAQTANSETEAELRRLKIQSDQWRKAAEAATAMLSTNNSGKYVERTGSLDYHTIGGKLRSPLSEDMDYNSSKKKNGNMLKKIGSLLKKGQK